MASGWPWGGLGVALGGFAQPPFWFQLSAFSFSAFQLLPKCGFVQPSFRFQLSAFQHFSFCRNVALCSPLSDFSFQLSAFQLLPKCGSGTSLSDFSFQHFSFSAFAEMWLWVAPPGCSRFEVRGSKFSVAVVSFGRTCLTLRAHAAVDLQVSTFCPAKPNCGAAARRCLSLL